MDNLPFDPVKVFIIACILALGVLLGYGWLVYKFVQSIYDILIG